MDYNYKLKYYKYKKKYIKLKQSQEGGVFDDTINYGLVAFIGNALKIRERFQFSVNKNGKLCIDTVTQTCIEKKYSELKDIIVPSKGVIVKNNEIEYLDFDGKKNLSKPFNLEVEEDIKNLLIELNKTETNRELPLNAALIFNINRLLYNDFIRYYVP